MTATVRDLTAAVAARFPVQWAEPWDQVGLLAGFPDSTVRGVLVTLDPTAEALERAIASGANVLVSHHPAFLHVPARLTEDAAPVVMRAAAAGVSLVAAHTNLDRSPDGGDALALALGFSIAAPLERGLQAVDLVVTYVPAASADAVVAAMSSAGAGRIGMYEGCAFTSEGSGRFVPMEGSQPAIGDIGHAGTSAETRIEMVAPRGGGARVAEAAREAHPYDEPVVLVQESAIARGAARLGRVCATGGMTLRELAEDAAHRLQVTPRIIGEPETLVETVAVANGSGGSLLGDALATGAEAFVAGELRYHDAAEAAAAGLAVIELGHDASEWPLVAVLAEAVRRTPGVDDALVSADEPGTLYWTP